ncbi:MAG: efflux RND transporter periplasmic adaptor subunit [Burkholderiales bacterium]
MTAVALGVGWWRDKPAPELYKTAALEQGSLQATVSATGLLNPVRQVQISSQISGQIKELLVDFNSPVKEGQLIARLDPETYEHKVRQATADLDAARAAALTAQANVNQVLAQAAKVQIDLQEAQRDWERKKELVARQFIAASEAEKALALVRSQTEAMKAAQSLIEVARAQAQSAHAVVRQREAVRAQAQVDVRRTEIRSPIDGIIIKRAVEVGQTVAASLQAPELFIIARNLHDMQVDASIDEADVSRIREGQKATFTIDAFPGRSFAGRVAQVRQAAINAQNVTTYTVVVAFTNPAGTQPLPGMTANVRIVTDERDKVLKLPNAALRVRLPEVSVSAEGRASQPSRDKSGASGSGAQRGRVFVLVSDAKGRSRPEPQLVRLGITDGLYTELLMAPDQASALREGSVVIVGLSAAPGKPGASSGIPRSPF